MYTSLDSKEVKGDSEHWVSLTWCLAGSDFSPWLFCLISLGGSLLQEERAQEMSTGLTAGNKAAPVCRRDAVYQKLESIIHP